MEFKGASFASIMLWAQLVNVFFPFSLAIDANCNLQQYLQPGITYYIYNSEYPNYYEGRNCRWMATSAAGTRINFACSHVDIKSVPPNCQFNRLAVSLSGDPNLNDALNYCGSQLVHVQSHSNKLTVAMLSSLYGGKGRFSCEMTVMGGGVSTTPKPTSTTPPPTPSCDCGWRQQRRIVGGTETGVNEYPFMAGIVDYRKSELWCGTTIISNRYGVTAAHCFTNRSATEYGLLAGDHNIGLGNEAPDVALYTLERYIIHEQYNPRGFINDIALVKTQNFIEFSVNVGPACLPFLISNLDTSNMRAQILGWGSTGISEPTSQVLLSADVNILSNSDCKQKSAGTDLYVDNTKLCTYEKGKDSCQFDSGGPVILWDWIIRRYYLVGIISNGVVCAGSTPGVNTRVQSYLQWIADRTSDRLCVK